MTAKVEDLRPLHFESAAFLVKEVMEELGYRSYAPLELQKRNRRRRQETGEIQRNFRRPIDPLRPDGAYYQFTCVWFPLLTGERFDVYIRKGPINYFTPSVGSEEELGKELGNIHNHLEELKNSVSKDLVGVVDDLRLAVEFRMLDSTPRLKRKPKRRYRERWRRRPEA